MLGEVNRFNLVILIDLNYLGIRSSYKFDFMSVTKETGIIKTGCLFGVLQLIESIASNYPFAKIIICDDGSPVERKKMFEGYKASRVSTPEKPINPEVQYWRNLKPELFRVLGGIPNLIAIKHPEKEADDLMARLAHIYRAQNRDVVVFTSDKDLMQLMSIGANISNEISDGELVLLTEEYVLNHDKLGVEPKYIPYLRPWSGDPSDDIPAAVSRVPKAVKCAVAQKWCESGVSELTEDLMNSILDSIDSVNITKVTRQKFLDGIEQANLNFKLMDLTKYRDESIESVQVIPLSYNESVLHYYSLNKYLTWRNFSSMALDNPLNLCRSVN